MKTIDIENRKTILKKAKKVLNCILEAKKRIDLEAYHINRWLPEFFYTQESCKKAIKAHKAAIVKLESYYRKIVSQL